MNVQRADLGFSDELESFDPTEWQPKPKKAQGSTPAAAQKAAEATGFKSREPIAKSSPDEPPQQQRRRRTGRNAQFNLKAKPETIEAFCSVADAQGWGLGETLEYAVELLENTYAKKG